jgi:hypothetical protein
LYTHHKLDSIVLKRFLRVVCQLEIVNEGMQRILLADFDLVAGRAGDQDEGQSLAATKAEFPTALVALTHDDMIQGMSTVR